jgi:hypothetical protein
MRVRLLCFARVIDGTNVGRLVDGVGRFLIRTARVMAGGGQSLLIFDLGGGDAGLRRLPIGRRIEIT